MKRISFWQMPTTKVQIRMHIHIVEVMSLKLQGLKINIFSAQIRLSNNEYILSCMHSSLVETFFA